MRGGAEPGHVDDNRCLAGPSNAPTYITFTIPTGTRNSAFNLLQATKGFVLTWFKEMFGASAQQNVCSARFWYQHHRCRGAGIQSMPMILEFNDPRPIVRGNVSSEQVESRNA
jgi:hypothetical protein